nr:hypothetical protein [Leifsonia xyli]
MPNPTGVRSPNPITAHAVSVDVKAITEAARGPIALTMTPNRGLSAYIPTR